MNHGGLRRIDGVTRAAMDAIRSYPWPGNVRELRSAVEYAFVVGEGPLLDVEDLTPELRGQTPPGVPSLSLADTERERMLRVLAQAQGPQGRPRQRSSGSAAPPCGVGSTPTTCAEGEGARGATPEETGIDFPVGRGTRFDIERGLAGCFPARRPTTGGPGHAATWPRSVTRCPNGAEDELLEGLPPSRRHVPLSQRSRQPIRISPVADREPRPRLEPSGISSARATFSGSIPII